VLATRQTVRNLEPADAPRYGGDRMRLRYIRRKYSRHRSYVWPPAWGGPYGLLDSPAVRQEGALTSVRRIGQRLSLTLRFNHQDHIGLLDEWNPPPTIDDVEAALRRGVERSIQEVGEIDVSGEDAAPIPDEQGF
jgi:hypothetical protein